MIARRPRRWVRLTWRANPQLHDLPADLSLPVLFIAAAVFGYIANTGTLRWVCVGIGIGGCVMIVWRLLLILLGRGRS